MDAALTNVITEAGIGEEGAEYLLKRNMITCRLLAACATSDHEFVEDVVKPFISGHTDGQGKQHKSTSDPLWVKATFLIAFRNATKFESPPPPQALALDAANAQPRPPTSTRAPTTL